MRVYAIDGSARKKGNTSTVLEAALEGAAEAADDRIWRRQAAKIRRESRMRLPRLLRYWKDNFRKINPTCAIRRYMA